MYADHVTKDRRDKQPAVGADVKRHDFIRDPFADPAAVSDLRSRPMSERLELALSWNKLASELQAGVKAAKAKSKLDS